MSMQMWRNREEKGGRWGGEGRRGGRLKSANRESNQSCERGGLALRSRDLVAGKNDSDITLIPEHSSWPFDLCGFLLGLARVTTIRKSGHHRRSERAAVQADERMGTRDSDVKLVNCPPPLLNLANTFVSTMLWVFATAQTKDGAPLNRRSVRNDLSTVLYRVGPLGGAGGGGETHSNKHLSSDSRKMSVG